MAKKQQIIEEEKKGGWVYLLGFALLLSVIFFIFYFLAEKLKIVPIPALTDFWGFTAAESGMVFAVMFVLILFLVLITISKIKSGKRMIQPKRDFEVKLLTEGESMKIKIKEGRIVKKNPRALIGGNVKETIEAKAVTIHKKTKKAKNEERMMKEPKENLMAEFDGGRIYVESTEIKVKRGRKREV